MNISSKLLTILTNLSLVPIGLTMFVTLFFSPARAQDCTCADFEETSFLCCINTSYPKYWQRQSDCSEVSWNNCSSCGVTGYGACNYCYQEYERVGAVGECGYYGTSNRPPRHLRNVLNTRLYIPDCSGDYAPARVRERPSRPPLIAELDADL